MMTVIGTSLLIALLSVAGLFSLYEAAMSIQPAHSKNLLTKASRSRKNKIYMARVMFMFMGWFLLLYGGFYFHLWLLPVEWTGGDGEPVREGISSLLGFAGTLYVVHHLQKNAANLEEISGNPLAEMDKRLVQKLKSKGFKVNDMQKSETGTMTATFKPRPRRDL